MSPTAVPVFLMCAALAAAPQSDPSGRRIVGEWRGTSLCTNLEAAPACKDETVRYVFTGPIGRAHTYHVVADKLVRGKYEAMGEMDFVYDGARRTWTCAFKTRRLESNTWWFRVQASDLVGGLFTDQGDTLRKVAARRHAR